MTTSCKIFLNPSFSNFWSRVSSMTQLQTYPRHEIENSILSGEHGVLVGLHDKTCPRLRMSNMNCDRWVEAFEEDAVAGRDLQSARKAYRTIWWLTRFLRSQKEKAVCCWRLWQCCCFFLPNEIWPTFVVCSQQAFQVSILIQQKDRNITLPLLDPEVTKLFL